MSFRDRKCLGSGGSGGAGTFIEPGPNAVEANDLGGEGGTGGRPAGRPRSRASAILPTSECGA